MTMESRDQVAVIFGQLRILRESVLELEKMESGNVTELRGQQTLDVDGAVHQSFARLLDNVAAMEELLATIAEATGDIPKL
ncbi:hypothetical protein BK653_12610 [Pseudomonas brassicacearum]|uniref:hypothetical protein n=1 Tax=Pseudomonas brassicacearum TaxID=930166 RepID=UPI000F46551B|nr:hypothetical protein [Pseudomonas brassicacearum]ROM69790.1 hypothetical protein BK653_12610 [Pseudomonas brassicacearum]